MKTPAEHKRAIDEIAEMYGTKAKSARDMAGFAPSPALKADLTNLADRYDTYTTRAQKMSRAGNQDAATGVDNKP